MKEVTRTFFENVNFQMDTDWKLGFTGRNGRGKTTFLKLLTGQMQYSGSIDASVDFEYFPYSVQNPEDFAVDVIREIAPAAEDWRIHRNFQFSARRRRFTGHLPSFLSENRRRFC